MKSENIGQTLKENGLKQPQSDKLRIKTITYEPPIILAQQRSELNPNSKAKLKHLKETGGGH